MLDDTLVPRTLFGGAVQMSFPARLVDISDFRPIPDSQEVSAERAAMTWMAIVESACGGSMSSGCAKCSCEPGTSAEVYAGVC